MVISVIGAPLADDDAAAAVDDDADAVPALDELDELELLLPHAATASALATVTTSTTRRWFTASLLIRFTTSRQLKAALNDDGRHQSRTVTARVADVKPPTIRFGFSPTRRQPSRNRARSSHKHRADPN
jgi:hypothetical protein